MQETEMRSLQARHALHACLDIRCCPKQELSEVV